MCGCIFSYININYINVICILIIVIGEAPSPSEKMQYAWPARNILHPVTVRERKVIINIYSSSYRSVFVGEYICL